MYLPDENALVLEINITDGKLVGQRHDKSVYESYYKEYKEEEKTDLKLG